MPLEAGDVLENRYRIEALLGQGEMGAVYSAWHLSLKVPVVVKENLLQSETARRQFSHKASTRASLRHPNLPHVNDFFSIKGQGQYLVMEFMDGQDLEQVLATEGGLPVARALDWISHVLEALEYLHSKNVIHRQVKPSNIKITPEGQVVLVDFGLAQEHDPTELTTVGAPGVTPGYAPLEQYRGSRTDARTDIYSAGATLYALLTGEAPPEAENLAICSAQLVPPRDLNPEVTPGLEGAILRAMKVAPDVRFQTVPAFREALREALAAGSPPPKDNAKPVMPPEPSLCRSKPPSYDLSQGRSRKSQPLRTRYAPGSGQYQWQTRYHR